jgi:hypothetical protein
VTPTTPQVWFRFWWRNGNSLSYAVGKEGDEYPGDWSITRAEAEKVRGRWLLFGVITEDTEWGIHEQEMDSYTVSTTEDNVVVALNEEHGYREWLWTTGMSAEQLKRWWREMDSVHPHFMDPSRTLPGRLEQTMFVGEGAACKATGEGSFAYVTLQGAWSAHIHTDEDSFLCPPGEGRITHKGLKKFITE